MKLYIAGPMTGLPRKNFPAFAKAAKALRRHYEVISPAELDVNLPETTWAACLKRDIRELITCDGVATLSNWRKSRGANLEVHIATQLGLVVHPVIYYLKSRLR
jgi:hypothetical protein